MAGRYRGNGEGTTSRRRDGRWVARYHVQTMHASFDLAAAGLPSSVRFHDPRHTAATPMLKKRVPANVVARVLGHSDPAMTLRRYALPGMQEMAAEAMESYAF